MKKLITLALALVVLAAFAGLGAAQETKAEPTAVERKQPKTGEKVDKASSKPMTGELTGKVTRVDESAKTFTVMFQGRALTFSAAKLRKRPTVGENIHIAFTLNPGELLPTATSPTGSPSMAAHHCWRHGHPLDSLNVCGPTGWEPPD